VNRRLSVDPLAEPSSVIARAMHDRLPERIRGSGTLFVWSPRAPRALRHSLRAYDYVDGCARIPLREGEVPACIAELVAELPPDTRALFVSGAGEPRLGDFAGMTTLHALDVLGQAGWILDQIAEGRFTSWFHPIVHAADTRRIFAHEALLRGVERDGSVVAPQPILDLAREAGLLFEVDSAACRSAIREAARHGSQMCVFINFSPAAIQDPDASLKSTLQQIDEANLPRDRVVFEVVEADRFTDSPHLEKVLAGYRSAGFRVALDDLGAGWSTLNLVHRLRPDFIKLDRELMRGVHKDPVKGLIADKLLEIGRGMGIGTIVEGIEEEDELEWCREHGADFVQGFLLGRPAPVARS
jgi:EAL domain-containing protein (putative c-di-GMP-specific phosphodiesterase class I)